MLANGEPVSYSRSRGFFERLARLNISLAFTSYQSGILYMLGSTGEHGPQMHQSGVSSPMGLAVAPTGGLVLAHRTGLIRYGDVLKSHERINDVFDACYVARTQHLTGELDVHDVAVDAQDRIVFVNTRFNCLATTSDIHSFAPIWRPHFVSALVDEDRCHLNGFALGPDGQPGFVTAVSRSDTIDGWRDRRADGGIVIDVSTDEIICKGLSMPHSPRWHRGQLWLLNSGSGELGTVAEDGAFEPRVFCPGFVRGLAFHEDLAFVGLSRPRYQRFHGLLLEQRLRDADSEAWCGIQVINLNTGACVDWFRIDGQVSELYDLAILPGKRCPMAMSPNSADADTLITFDPMPGALGLGSADQQRG
jgi:uncharacterized protein (TIGR03032 family)